MCSNQCRCFNPVDFVVQRLETRSKGFPNFSCPSGQRLSNRVTGEYILTVTNAGNQRDIKMLEQGASNQVKRKAAKAEWKKWSPWEPLFEMGFGHFQRHHCMLVRKS